jgi:hypothetical protein
MPSWNIHTAHVERLLAHHRAHDLGIEDANAFLFGNFVPDVYVGFMVPDVSMHVDYCVTHFARLSMIPVSDADLYWDFYIACRAPETPSGMSLVLGAWAHLVADRFYNGRFRTFWHTHDVPGGDEQRIAKQADYDLFGHTLGISSLVKATPELLEAAYDFRPYRILAEDVRRAVDTANRITRESANPPAGGCHFRLLDPRWFEAVFAACDERLAVWLQAWQQLEREGKPAFAADIRAQAGLQAPIPDTNDWMNR